MDAGSSLQNILGIFIQQAVGSLPLLIVYIGGIIFTLMLWNRQPRASLLALLGLVLMLLTSLLGSCLFAWTIHDPGPDFKRGTLLTIIGLVRSLFTATGLGLVLAAVFVGRARPPRGAVPLAQTVPPTVQPVSSGPSPHVTTDRPPPP